MGSMTFQKDNGNRQWDYKSFGNMGTNLHPMQGNQLQQLNQMISAGPGGSEIITLRRDIWETIPKQHFEEMRRLSTLTGVEPSIHAPLIDPVGTFQTPAGKIGFSEEVIKSEQRFIKDVLEKATTLVSKDNPRNVPVNIHPDVTSMGPVYRIAQETIKDAEGKVVVEKGKEYKELDWGIDVETGNPAPLKFEVKYAPPEKPSEEKQGYHLDIWTPERKLDSQNGIRWRDEVAGTFGSTELQKRQFEAIRQQLHQGKTVQEEALLQKLESDVRSKAESMFDDLKRFSIYEGDNWEKYRARHLVHMEKEKQDALEKGKEGYDRLKKKMLEENTKLVKVEDEIREKLKRKQTDEEKAALLTMKAGLDEQKVGLLADFFQKTVDLGAAPRKIIPFEEFALDKAPDTFAQAALDSYELAKKRAADFKKEGTVVDPLDVAPLVNIENMPANQFAFGRAGQLKQLIIDSREKTVERLMKEKKMGKAEAEKIADRIIGATWDVGHINMLRPSGYGSDDILKEAKEIAPYVRHFHVTDNFGTTDSHLVPGQGTAIPGEQVAAIKKAAAEAGVALPEKTKEIMEIGGFVEHHKVSPWPFTLSYFNSPIYEMDAGPTWSEKAADLGTNYFFGSSEYVTGAGNILPEAHFGMYGAGFSGLPTAFGSPIAQGDRSRFAGAPMS